MAPPSMYGLVAEFKDADSLIGAARRVCQAGYKRMDAYTPFPVHGLAEAMEFEDARVPWIIFLSGLAGGISAYALQWWINVIEYPINSGGRPHHSWPSFIPVTFELTILFASFGALLGMLSLNGLPRPYHPVFSAPNFERASQDGFFLSIEERDPLFDREGTRRMLEDAGAVAVSEVGLGG